MSKRLNEIVGNTAVKILRDVYIWEIDKNQICKKYRVETIEIDLMLEKVSKHLVYQSRAQSYNISASQIIFHKKDLLKWVWREFLIEQIDQGKTTDQISIEVNRPLGTINGYLM